jgi:hypothetical protein
MRTLLLGTDFMYDNNGNLKPIEINTSVGYSGIDKLESDTDVFDLTNLINFIQINNFTKIEYIGNIIPFFNNLSQSISVPCEIHTQGRDSITIPYIEDDDETLIIRSAYDTLAVVDDLYCRDKTNFYNLIKNSAFGHEFAYMDDQNNLVNTITTINDNGNHPNFLLKAITPQYDKEVYPYLYKITTQQELNNLLSTLTSGYLLMPYYYNIKNIQEGFVSVIRSLNLLFPPNLESIHIGCYHKICENIILNNAEYDGNLKLNSEFREQYVTETKKEFLPKLDDTDLVELADGSFKTAADLQVGDLLKTIDIPNPFNVDKMDEMVNYRIPYDELVQGATFSTNAITSKKQIKTKANLVTIKFTDGTDWLDYAGSNYLVERNNEVRFIPTIQLISGDKLILIDTSSTGTLSFVEKIVDSITSKIEFFNGWYISVERTHLFLTKESGDNSNSYVAIEHNTSQPCNEERAYCGHCESGCVDCPKGKVCVGGFCVNLCEA